MVRGTIEMLRRVLDQSSYTVVLLGSQIKEEAGFYGLKSAEKAYEIEKKYKTSPDYIFSSVYYNTRTDQFFDFYKNEIIREDIEPTESSYALAAMERAGKVQCIVSNDVFELSQRAGCQNVINLRGSIYRNQCLHCGKEYSIDYIRKAKGVPLCEVCNSVIRPGVYLFGEMLDSRLMTKTAEEVEKADVLLMVGTDLDSETFQNYLKYFGGSKLVVIHEKEHYMDQNADIVFVDQPKNVLPKLGY